jgi:hypothetical protein
MTAAAVGTAATVRPAAIAMGATVRATATIVAAVPAARRTDAITTTPVAVIVAVRLVDTTVVSTAVAVPDIPITVRCYGAGDGSRQNQQGDTDRTHFA